MGQQVLIDSDSLTAIADAIRAKTNQDTKFKPAECLRLLIIYRPLRMAGLK